MRPQFAVLFLLLISSSISVFAQQPTASEIFLFDAVNHERVNRNLPRLNWDPALASAAHAHALRMVAADNLSHQLPDESDLLTRIRGVGAHFSRVAENIAQGAVPEDMHAGWMRSPGHRRNILDPQLTAIGISVVQGKNMLFGVQDFAHSLPRLSLEEQEGRVGKMLAARGLQIRRNAEDARKACRSIEKYSGPAPVSIFRFDASELDRLPDRLEQKIKRGNYHSAAVGSCTNEELGFTGFRIALLLY